VCVCVCVCVCVSFQKSNVWHDSCHTLQHSMQHKCNSPDSIKTLRTWMVRLPTSATSTRNVAAVRGSACVCVREGVCAWERKSTRESERLKSHRCHYRPKRCYFLWFRSVSRLWMSHVTHMNASCHTYECVMSHLWMSHTYGCVMSHISMRHVTHMNQSCQTLCDMTHDSWHD